MMGHKARSEALFYYFRLEDQVPENHLLRLIAKHISFEFVRKQLKKQLQRDRSAIGKSGTAVAHSADRVSLRHHE
jgi:transposase